MDWELRRKLDEMIKESKETQKAVKRVINNKIYIVEKPIPGHKSIVSMVGEVDENGNKFYYAM